MDFIVIPMVAGLASLLTFFSGFGLGTLLTPVFAIFFPVELAIGLTAIVHFLNGLFKLSLVGRYADKNILIRFGLPAIVSAALGAWVLSKVSDLPALHSYFINEHQFHILPLKLILGLLIAVFTLFELIPKLRNLEINFRYLSLGGFISGFFGGLSGHQGALRAAFLARAGLSKEQFVATGTVIALMIDISRITTYSKHLSLQSIQDHTLLLSLATFFAFLGAYFGNKLLKKVTMKGVQTFVSISLFILAVALSLGII
jgi:uncharacterized membrane protein YfcA